MTSAALFIALTSGIVVLSSDFLSKRVDELKEYTNINNEIINKVTCVSEYSAVETVFALTIYHYMMFKIILHRFYIYMMCIAVITTMGMNVMYSGAFNEDLSIEVLGALTLGNFVLIAFLTTL